MLHPDECSHRSSQMAVDLAYICARYINTLSQFISKKELFHLEMNTLYVLIDLMVTTSNTDPEIVLEHCKTYFQRLRNSEFVNRDKYST